MQAMRLRGHGERGWTLAELSMTLFAIGLFFALSAPAMARIGERMERELFLDFLASELQFARAEALARERETLVQLESGKGMIRVIQDGRELRYISVPPRYRMESNYPEGRILFRETGQVRGGTIRLIMNGRVVGRVTVQVASGLPVVELMP